MQGFIRMAKKKILVVDDEEDIRTLVKTLLNDEGYNVEAAKDGEEAIAKMNRIKFDLVLVDMFMPGMSGREMCEHMRKGKKTKDNKCAFLTVAQFSPEGEKEIKKLGCLDYIRKPVDNDDFKRRIKALLK